VKILVTLSVLGLFSFCKTIPKFVPVSEHNLTKIQSDGIERDFHYYIPKNKTNTKYSLIFILHGGGGSGEGMIYLTRMSDLASENNYIAVYPNGFENRWNDGRSLPHSSTDKRNTKDVLFFRQMIEYFKTKYEIDTSKIHVVGLSNGGFMAQRILCEAADIFASGFSIAATTSKFISEQCSLPEPVSLGFIFGKKDDVVPYKGGSIQIPISMEPNAAKVFGGESLSFLESLSIWKKRLKCDKEEIEYIDGLKKKTQKDILKYSFTNCSTNSMLNAYLIESGGHFWPHGFYYLNEKNSGYLTNDLDATKVVIQFFKQTPKSIMGVN